MDAATKYPEHLHRKDLTFRQAEGIHPLPKMLVHGELDRALRVKIWDAFYRYFTTARVGHAQASFNYRARCLAEAIVRDAQGHPLDDATAVISSPTEFLRGLKRVILEGHYGDCLEIVQVALRSGLPSDIQTGLT